MEMILDFCLSHYWMGVIIGFVMIFLHLKIYYTTDFDCKFTKGHYLFLILSFLSWIVPMGYVIGLVGFGVYFILSFIFSFFKTY